MLARTQLNLHLAALAATTAALVVTAGASAQFDLGGQRGQAESAGRYASVRAAVDRQAVGPGDSFHIAVIFDIQPRWHIYWKNPGEGALAPSVNITGPAAFETGDILWPRPKIVESPVGDLFCLEGSTALFVPVTAPLELDEGDAAFSAEVRFAVCDNRQCFFGRETLSVSVKTSSAPVIDARQDARLVRHRARLPILITPESEDASASITADGEKRTLIITGPAHGFSDAQFFPLNSPGVRYGKPAFSFENDRFRAVIELTVNHGNFTRGAPDVGGLVGLGAKTDDPSYEVTIPLIRTSARQ